MLPCSTVTDRLLAGMRVLELAQDIAGPYGGKLLGDLGAEVVKVEPPGRRPQPSARTVSRRSLDRSPEQPVPLSQRRQGSPPARSRPSPEPGRAGELCRWADVMLESGGLGRGWSGSGLGEAGCGSSIHGWCSCLGLALRAVRAAGGVAWAMTWSPSTALGFAFGFPALQVESLDLPPLNAPSYGAAFLAGELIAAAAVHGLLLASATATAPSSICRSRRRSRRSTSRSSTPSSGPARSGVRQPPRPPTRGRPAAALQRRLGRDLAARGAQWTRWLEGDRQPGLGPGAALRRPPRPGPALDRALPRCSPPGPAALAPGHLRGAPRPPGSPATRSASQPTSSPPPSWPPGSSSSTRRRAAGSLRFPGIPYRIEGGAGAGLDVPARLLRHVPCSASPSKALPLAGVRIVDFSWVLTGPICTKFLAALGAEVIKVESRARPDLSQRDGSWEELNPSKTQRHPQPEAPAGARAGPPAHQRQRRGGRELLGRGDGAARARLRGAQRAQPEA